MNIYFENNKGQDNDEIKFYFKSNNLKIYFLEKEVLISIVYNQSIIKKDKVNLKFENSNENVKIYGEDKLITPKISYIKNEQGIESKKNIDIFNKLIYKDIYKNIDMVYYGIENKLKYDFVIYKDGNYKDIEISIEDNYNIKLDSLENLHIKNNNISIVFYKPVSYQIIKEKKIYIQSKFIIKENKITFDIKDYDKNYDLIIDPFIEYSTYLGGSESEYPSVIAIDEEENMYIAGETVSKDFENTQLNELTDLKMYISKINKNKKLEWLTYIDCSFYDEIKAIEVDKNGDIYICGYCYNGVYPIKNQVKEALVENYDNKKAKIFISKIRVNYDNAELVFSSLIGGMENDYAYSMKVDDEGSIYIVGETQSFDFPTKNQLNIPSSKSANGFIIKIILKEDKINSEVGYLVFSSILGGSQDDYVRNMDIDNLNNIYLIGKTLSTDFPIKNQMKNENKYGDIFVTKVKLFIENEYSQKGEVLFSTRLGNNSLDFPKIIRVDSEENIYIGGNTDASDYPIKNPIYKYEDLKEESRHVFISKIKSNELIFSTYLGGNFIDEITSLEIDKDNNIYVSGITFSSNFPLIKEIMKFPKDNVGNGYICKIRLDENNKGIIEFSTYLGGNLYDKIYSMKVDTFQNIYTTGVTYSKDFPVVNELHGYKGSSDIFITKINKHDKLFEDNTVMFIKKSKLSYEEAKKLSCYINLPIIENSAENEIIKEIYFKSNDICKNQSIPARTKVKDIYLSINISYYVVLYSGNSCTNDLKIYAMEEMCSNGDVFYGCVNMDKTIDIKMSDLDIKAYYEILDEDTVKDYYVYQIKVIAYIK